MMKPVTSLEEIQHLVEKSDVEIFDRIQEYIDNQLLFLNEEKTEYLAQKQA